jgi:hypothetical protein
MEDSEKIQSIVVAFGHRARSGKDEACKIILSKLHGKPVMEDDPSITWNIKHYSFAKALKAEVTKLALNSGGMRALFSDGYRYDGAGFARANGDIVALPDWVQYDLVDGDPDCPLGKSRTFLQFWGVFRREDDPNHWVKQVHAQIAADKPDVALISDCRFMNEMTWAQRYGFVVRVDRVGLPPLRGISGMHVSELALAGVPDEDWDSILVNDSDLEAFRERTLFIFQMLMSAVPTVRPASA